MYNRQFGGTFKTHTGVINLKWRHSVINVIVQTTTWSNLASGANEGINTGTVQGSCRTQAPPRPDNTPYNQTQNSLLSSTLWFLHSNSHNFKNGLGLIRGLLQSITSRTLIDYVCHSLYIYVCPAGCILLPVGLLLVSCYSLRSLLSSWKFAWGQSLAGRPNLDITVSPQPIPNTNNVLLLIGYIHEAKECFNSLL